MYRGSGGPIEGRISDMIEGKEDEGSDRLNNV